MKIEIEAKELEAGEKGNSFRRLIFSGPIWDEWDLEFCIHGEKLRWRCDDCEAHFTSSERS